MRVKRHPILGDLEEGEVVEIEVDGETIEALAGEPIAAALTAAGKAVLRYTQKRRDPRGVFCAIGRCTDCMMTVDGVPNVRTCVTPVEPGMVIETQEGTGRMGRLPPSDPPRWDLLPPSDPPRWGGGRRTDLAVVGAGPAGLSAAIEASEAGADVVLIDENEKAGGQLFKQIHKFFGSSAHRAGVRGIDIGRELLEDVEQSGADVLLNSTVWGLFDDHTIGIIQDDKNVTLEADSIILATGALENAVTFPGWTLPGVMGAGAIQTMVNVHRVLPGHRILMVGSGNVGLIVSYQLLQAGADVVAIVEAAPGIGGYGVHASKVRRKGVPILTSTTVSEAYGDEKVEGAVLVDLGEGWQPIPSTRRSIDVDVICLACGLSPLSELAWMAGCRFTYIPTLGGHVPIHDADMETTVPGLYVAGDVAGVEEASTAMEEGRLSGVAAAESLGWLAVEEAAAKKTEVRARLDDLRQGPFGEARRKAKAKQVSEGEAR